MMEDLRRSGLEKYAGQLKLEPLPEGHGLVAPDWAGYRIPYWTPDGRQDKFFRFRYLQYKPANGWRSAAEPKKPRRYAQPAGTEPAVYLPPVVPWPKVMVTPEIPLCITEGEKKAAAASLHEVMPTLGLGGVYSWMSKRLQYDFLPILARFNWLNRDVYLCFDSDVTTNPMVQIALGALARRLTAEGALIHNVLLEPGPDGSKRALDDAVVELGGAETEKLLKAAPGDRSSAALHALNTEVAALRSTGEIVCLDGGTVLSARKFTDAVYRNRQHTEYRTNADGTTTGKPVFTAQVWLAWKHRTELYGITYAPGRPRVAEDEAGRLCYNNWPGWGCQPRAGNTAPWERLFAYLTGDLPSEQAAWLRAWFAYPLQKPGTKLYSAVILWGAAQGTGKTLLGETMRRIYGSNFRSVSNADLASQYNDWVCGSQFIIGDELVVDGRRSVADNLKNIITRERVVVNRKYQAQFEITDCVNYYFTSNHANAFFIEDADRRYFVHEVPSEPLPRAFYEEYLRWLDREGGAAALFDALLRTDTGAFDPRAPAPVTSSKREMVAAGRSDLADWCALLRDDPDRALRAASGGLSGANCLYTTAELLLAYDPERRTGTTAPTMSRELYAAGIPRVASGSNHCYVAGARQRLYVVRQRERLRLIGPAEASRLYEQERAAVAPRKFEGKARRVQ